MTQKHLLALVDKQNKMIEKLLAENNQFRDLLVERQKLLDMIGKQNIGLEKTLTERDQLRAKVSRCEDVLRLQMQEIDRLRAALVPPKGEKVELKLIRNFNIALLGEKLDEPV